MKTSKYDMSERDALKYVVDAMMLIQTYCHNDEVSEEETLDAITKISYDALAKVFKKKDLQ